MGFSSDREIRFAFEMRFDLRGLLYAHATPTLLRQAANAMQAERSLTDRVVELVFRRIAHECRLQDSSQSRSRATLELLRIDASLNQLTGGCWEQVARSEEGVDVQLSGHCRPFAPPPNQISAEQSGEAEESDSDHRGHISGQVDP